MDSTEKMRLGMVVGLLEKEIELQEAQNQKLDIIISAFKSWQSQDKDYHERSLRR